MVGGGGGGGDGGDAAASIHLPHPPRIVSPAQDVGKLKQRGQDLVLTYCNLFGWEQGLGFGWVVDW